jgi:hypothetical protein
MAISTIGQNGLNAPITLTSPVINTVTSASATALTLQSAGTTGLVISTAGLNTRPLQTACLVRTSGNIDYSSINTFQKVAFNTVINQTGSSFNTSTNRFTAPVDGWYFVSSTVYMYPTSQCDMNLYKNGSNFLRSAGSAAASNVNPNGGQINTAIYLSATDYLELYVQSPATCTIYQGSPYTTYFSAYLLG